MGLLSNLFGGSSESREEIAQRIQNSECGQLFASHLCAMFNPGSSQLQWLMANSKERMYKLDVFKNGVSLTQIEVNQRRLKETGTYDVDSEGWGFGASGYEDLPNSQYVSEFRSFLLSAMRENCPSITIIFNGGDYIKLNEAAKKGW